MGKDKGRIRHSRRVTLSQHDALLAAAAGDGLDIWGSMDNPIHLRTRPGFQFVLRQDQNAWASAVVPLSGGLAPTDWTASRSADRVRGEPVAPCQDTASNRSDPTLCPRPIECALLWLTSFLYSGPDTESERELPAQGTSRLFPLVSACTDTFSTLVCSRIWFLLTPGPSSPAPSLGLSQ